MVLDHLSNASLYYGISSYVAQGLQWIENNAAQLATMENGQYEIDGENVYAIVNSYDTKPVADCGWEGHKKYCDIHYSVSGSERIGYAHISGMSVTKPHDSEKDYALFDGKGDFMTVGEGMFCLLKPEDIHAPGGNTDNESQFLKKVVIKLLA